MRILTLAPIFGGGIPLVEDIQDALGCLNVEHRVINRPDWVSAYREAAAERNPLPFYAKVHAALDEEIETFRPDLVLTFALAPIPPGFGTKLKSRGIKTAHWFFEDGKRFPVYERMVAEHDHFFAIQPALAATLQSKGHEKARYLPLGVPPRARREDLPRTDTPKHPIAFVGTPSKRREELFRGLIPLGLKLWGPGWQDLDPAFAGALQEDGRWLSRDEELQVYLSAQLVVNLHQDTPKGADPDFINPRTFVLAALGVPQTLEDRLELAPLFDLTNELSTFKPTVDLRTRVEELLEAPEKLSLRAERARGRALENHLLEHRLTQILDRVTG